MYARKERSFDEHYDNLTSDQLLTIYTHQTFGYLLWFVRTVQDNNKVAILRQGKKLISVNSDGVAQEEINVQLRDMDVVNPSS